MPDYELAGKIFGGIVTLSLTGMLLYFVYRFFNGAGDYLGGILDYLTPGKNTIAHENTAPDKSQPPPSAK